MADKKVKRQYVVLESHDKKLQEWADKIPDMDKSAILRIVMELGLADFAESSITLQLVEGSLWRKSGGSILSDEKKPRATRRVK